MIYLDPPFNSNRMFEAPIGSPAEGSGFKDVWRLDDIDLAWHEELRATANDHLHDVILAAKKTAGPKMMSYLIYMTVRLLEMRRVLKTNGSIFLHCDDRAGAYLRVLMDGIFTTDWYKNEIIWRRTTGRSDGNKFGRVHDEILYYAGPGATWNPIYRPHDPEHIAKKYTKSDAKGRWGPDQIMGPSGGGSRGQSSQPWRGVDPAARGRCWSAPKTGRMAKFIRRFIPDYPEGYPTVHSRLDALDANGFIHWTRTGQPKLKFYLEASPGRRVVDVFDDINKVGRHSKERTAFRTQKPTALVARLVEAATDPGDLVLDPFAGCATTAIAAQKLGRRWAGVDMSPTAVNLVRHRLAEELGLDSSLAIARDDTPVRTDLGKIPPPRNNLEWLYGIQEGYCAGCGNHYEAKIIQVDHIVAKGAPERGGRGGTDHWSNLQLLCGHCNQRKSDHAMSDFVAKIVAEQGGYDPAIEVRRKLAAAKAKRAKSEGIRC